MSIKSKILILAVAILCAFILAPCYADSTPAPMLGANSVYTIQEVPEGSTDYTFTTKTVNTSGALEPHYFKIVIKPAPANKSYDVIQTTSRANNISFVIPAETGGTPQYYSLNISPSKMSNGKISWSTTSQTGSYTGYVTFKLPNATTATTLYYKYDLPTGYTATNTRIDNTVSAGNVDKKLFNNINAGANFGGAILNYSDNSAVNVNSDFIGNYAGASGDNA